jgi:capsular exopolysaccharide synthesis family protein
LDAVLVPGTYDLSPSNSEPGGSVAFTLSGMFWFLRRQGWILLAGIVLGGLAGVAYWRLATPVYVARALVEVQSYNDKFLNLEELNPTAGGYADEDFQTQVRILEASSLAKDAAAKLRSGLPEDPPLPQGLDWVRMRLHLDPAPVRRQQALAIARDSLKVQAFGKSRLVEIRASSTHPEMASGFINQLTEEFIERGLQTRWDSAKRTSQWLTRQLEDVRQKLERSETALQHFVRSAGLVVGEGSDANAEIRDLQQELTKASADRAIRQSRYEIAAKSQPDAIPELLDDTSIRTQRATLEELRVQLAEASATLTGEHYRVKRLRSQIREVESSLAENQARILARLGHESESAARRYELLQTLYKEQLQHAAGQSAKLAQYNVLRQDVETIRRLYDSLLQRVKESGIATALRASNVRIVEAANPPTQPAHPDATRSVALGLTCGLLAALGLIFTRELSDASLRAPGEARQYLHVTELGVIPAEAFDRHEEPQPLEARTLGLIGPAAKEQGEHERLELVIWQKKRSALAESFRTTLTSILFTKGLDAAPRTFVVTSPNPREGKTVASCNLAAALVEIGRRTLLIDADLHNPSLHNLFDLPNDMGLSDLVASADAIEDCPVTSLVRETHIPNLYLLPSGPAPISIPKLLHSHRMGALMKAFRAGFDCVIIDTPPMLQFPDARILAKLADGVLLIFRAGSTNRTDAAAAIERFQEDGTRVLGTILNDWDPRSSTWRDYGSYYSYYRDRSRG